MGWSSTHVHPDTGALLPVPVAEMNQQCLQLKGLISKLIKIPLKGMDTFASRVEAKKQELHRNQPKRTKTVEQDIVKKKTEIEEVKYTEMITKTKKEAVQKIRMVD